MSDWYIGIDESGSFKWNKKTDKSFVCAVVTKKNESDCEVFLRDCAQAVNPNLYNEAICQAQDSNSSELKSVIGSFFHGMEIWKRDPIFAKSILGELIHKGDEYFHHVVISEPGGESAINSQHYYLQSLYDVLAELLDSNLFNNGDTIHIHIAERIPEVTGTEKPIDIVLAQLSDNYDSLRKNNYIDEADKIFYAWDVVRNFGVHRQFSQGRLQPLENFRDESPQYRDLLEKGRIFIEQNVKRFLETSYPQFNYDIKSQSARCYSLPALADQAVNIVRAISGQDTFTNEYIADRISVAKKHTLAKGLDVSAYVNEGDLFAAVKIFMDRFYNAGLITKEDLEIIFEQATENQREELWKILVEHCEEKMQQRGEDGEVITKTKKLLEIFQSLFYAYYPEKSNLPIRFLKMKGECAAHNGDIDIKSEEEFLEEIQSFLEETSNLQSYEELHNLYIEQLTNGVAQVRFNSYMFENSLYQNALEEYRKSLMNNNDFFEKHPDFIDSKYAKIKGTIGQALVFNGNYVEGLKELEDDFNHASEQKDMVASFILITYLKLNNLAKAKEWFKKETQAAFETEISFEEFGSLFDSRTDTWIGLNYLRLCAYSINNGETVPNIPDFTTWNRDNAGDYPWALLLKWQAYIYEKMGNRAAAISLLDDSIQRLVSSNSFTIKSLALSPLWMKVILGTDSNSFMEYKKLLEELQAECPTFKDYSTAHNFSEISNDLWKALTMLPFNYS